MRIVTRYSTEPRAYTGVELRPHFLLCEMGLQGSAIGAWVGPCHVKTEHLVDWEDRLANDKIEAKLMVHFIGEFFGTGLREMVFFQRLVSAMATESLNARLGGLRIRRSGDDLFYENRKLSVSIVTASPVSQVMHFGINVDPTGAPVPAVGLAELGIDPGVWILEFLEAVKAECQGIDWACAKVRPVV